MRDQDLLDQIIVSLSEDDPLPLRSFVAGGTLILGDSGSGKSSTSLKQIICGFMRAGLGGILTTTKPDDAAEYLAYARACGKENEVLVFSEDSGLTFDPLAYEWSRTSGRGAGMVEACIDFFSTLMSINKPQGENSERFWELYAQLIIVLQDLFIIQSGLSLFLKISALALAVKSFIGWYRFFEYKRDILDAQYLSGYLADLADNSTPQEKLRSIPLASVPSDIPETLRTQAAMTMARASTPAKNTETRRKP